MNRTILLTPETEAALDKYRAARKTEAGKMITRNTAACEIILRYMAGIKPVFPMDKRIQELEKRVCNLEKANMQRRVFDPS